ncbi:apolipoprotein L3-like isoform X2 [Alexandromys fortis]|uniref:apolipoprotein L3-like isoform X2 n=1 Tax=Alexandromys fortis TaxID=100897 RepID=UPI002152CAFD|nr:apolipoprotein L3-like isoform X2 [Microtus fortis]XP_050001122.1 apolipoprotein L3-like isoform X2 [Microtus fortis]
MERKGFIMSVVEYLWDTRNTEALQVLPTKEESGIQLVERAGLSSFSPFNLMLAVGLLFIVYIIYRKLKDASPEKKRFLEVYPQMKRELEESIRKLHALADKIDKVHRDCTITQVVASSTGAASGVMTILGLALAPVTAGVSLGLSATGLGLGAAAAMTSVSTTIVEKVSTASAEAEASQLLPRSNDTENDIKEVFKKNASRLFSVFMKSSRNLEGMRKNIDAIKLTKASPRLTNNAKRLMTTGKVSAQSTRQVEKAFGGTALAMTKRARIMGAATAGLTLVLDVVSLIEDSKHLQEGAKAESAAKLRQKAQELEQKLQELIQVHDILTQ